MQVIDRRLAGKNKSIGNRERFLRRHQDVIREAVRRAIDGRKIKDIGTVGEEVHVPKKDLQQPIFGHGQGGKREIVHPGNKEYLRGDRIQRPTGGGSGGFGKGEASDTGEGDDDFVFTLSKEEFMQIFFKDLALPNLLRTQLAETPEFTSRRAGFVSDGSPNNLHVVRSMRGALGRRIALGASARRTLAEMEATLTELQCVLVLGDAVAMKEIATLMKEISRFRSNMPRIPYLDPIDLRYRNRVRVPTPMTKAVMFCLMDVSGSMDENRKELSKRFFILLYLFLTRHYEHIELVFIRHHVHAEEVDEQNFFHSTETGGTIVSSALILMEEIIRARYSSDVWNVYGAQASDGDNHHHDSSLCRTLLRDKVLPLCRYFAYLQVAEQEQDLWDEYLSLMDDLIEASVPQLFAMRKATSTDQIYPVFRDLFKSQARAA